MISLQDSGRSMRNALVASCIAFSVACQPDNSNGDRLIVGPQSQSVFELFDSIEQGNIELVQKILDKGISASLHTSEHGSLLGAAVRAKNEKLVKYLIGRGSDVNYQSHQPSEGGYTALILALLNHDCSVVKILLDAGADPNLKFLNAGHGGMGEYKDMTASQIYQYDLSKYPELFKKETTCWGEVRNQLVGGGSKAGG